MDKRTEYFIGAEKGTSEEYDYQFAYSKKDLQKVINQLKEEGWNILLVLEVVIIDDLTAQYV